MLDDVRENGNIKTLIGRGREVLRTVPVKAVSPRARAKSARGRWGSMQVTRACRSRANLSANVPLPAPTSKTVAPSGTRLAGEGRVPPLVPSADRRIAAAPADAPKYPRTDRLAPPGVVTTSAVGADVGAGLASILALDPVAVAAVHDRAPPRLVGEIPIDGSAESRMQRLGGSKPRSTR